MAMSTHSDWIQVLTVENIFKSFWHRKMVPLGMAKLLGMAKPKCESKNDLHEFEFQIFKANSAAI